MINAIQSNSVYWRTQHVEKKQDTKENNVQKHEEQEVVLELEKKTSEKTATYSKPVDKRPNASQIQKLWEEANRAHESLRNMVEKLILKQAGSIEAFKASGESLQIDEETRLQAQMAIAEDGEFGVNAVSDRIVAFAIAISGGDKSKLNTLKAAIDEGFQAVKDIMGGALPDISSKTYDEIMRKLDEWADDEQ
jgi:hypothetical protein